MYVRWPQWTRTIFYQGHMAPFCASILARHPIPSQQRPTTSLGPLHSLTHLRFFHPCMPQPNPQLFHSFMDFYQRKKSAGWDSCCYTCGKKHRLNVCTTMAKSSVALDLGGAPTLRPMFSKSHAGPLPQSPSQVKKLMEPNLLMQNLCLPL